MIEQIGTANAILPKKTGVDGLLYPLPERVEVTSSYGWRTHPIYGDRRLHTGIDLGGPQGMPVLAVKDGVVEYADWGSGYGQMIDLAHDGLKTRYGHLSEILVKQGDRVKRGQAIGRVGETGGVTGPHLHFEILTWQQDDWKQIDPAAEMKF